MSFDNVQQGFNKLILDTIKACDEFQQKREQKEKEFVDYADSLLERLKILAKEKDEQKNGRKPKRTKAKKEQVLSELPNVTNSLEKPRRMASQVASLMINKQAHEKKNIKLRRPSDSVDLIASHKAVIAQEISVKVEKDAELIIENSVEMMPPPAITKTKKTRQKKIKVESDSDTTDTDSSRPIRSTRSKAVKKAPETEEKPARASRRKKKADSDIVVIPNEPVPCVILTDTDSEDDRPLISKKKEAMKTEKQEKEKTTERKMSNSSDKTDERKRQKYETSEEEDNKQAKKRTKKGTRTKTNKKEQEKIPVIVLENIKQETSIYEDAVSQVKETNPGTPKPCDATYQVTTSPVAQPILNQTVTVSLPLLKEPEPLNQTVTVSQSTLNHTVTISKEATNGTFSVDKTKDDELIVKNKLSNCVVAIENNAQVEEKVNEKTLDVPLQKDPVVSLEKDPVVEEKVKEIQETKIANEAKILSPKNVWEKPQEIPNESPDLTDDDSDLSPIKITKQLKTPKNKIYDESSEQESSQERPKPKKGLKTKPMFSPYANSPVKKRVAAFEKMGTDTVSAATTTRVTRTKTKKLAEKENSKKSEAIPKPATGKFATKYITPVHQNKLKSLIPHTDGRPALNSTKQNMSTLSNNSELQKSQSVNKPTRAQLIEKNQEKQKLLLEKEDEAKRKKEALMQAKAEESKRLREEKMQRAQKAREEKERIKEEKLRQVLAEKEEKQKEELERKKAWLIQKAIEQEEQRRIVEQNRIQRQKEMLYIKQQEAKAKKKPPPLPTADCYDTDSDDEDVRRPKVVVPDWCHKSKLFPILHDMLLVPKAIIYSHFSVKPTTPDLEDIFENIPRTYLKRNSSAVWRTPPRYSTLPKL